MRPEDKILYAFYSLRTTRLYYNQIKEETKLSDNTLSRILITLIREKILKKEPQKSNTFYSLIDFEVGSIMFSKFDLRLQKKLHQDITIPLHSFISQIPKEIFSIVFFGSASRNEEEKNSDIDLIVVFRSYVDVHAEELETKRLKQICSTIQKKINEIALYPLSLVFCSYDEFLDTHDVLLNLAKQSGFPLIHQQTYHKQITFSKDFRNI